MVHCLLLWLDCSSEKSPVIIIFVLLCIMCLFLWVLLRFFSFSLALSNLIIMCLGLIFFTFLMFRAHWAFWICRFIVLIMFVNFFGHYIFEGFFFFLYLLPSGVQLHTFLWSWSCSTTGIIYCSFFSFFFLLCILFSIVWIAMSLALLIFSPWQCLHYCQLI